MNKLLKELYRKTDGVLFCHMVQSFPKGEAVDPVTAHAAAVKLDEYYEGCKVRREKSRRDITYTTPSGWQCRERLLFGDKYLKPSCADNTAYAAADNTGADVPSRSASHERGVQPVHLVAPPRNIDELVKMLA